MEARPEIKLKMQPVDIVLEVVGYAGLAVLWVFISMMYNHLPDTVATHFNLAGEADGYGEKRTIFMMPIMASLQFIILSAVQEYPHLFNYPVTITPENVKRQYTNAIRMMRVLKIVLVAIFGTIEIYSNSEYLGLELNGYWLMPVVLAILILPIGYFIVKAYRQR